MMSVVGLVLHPGRDSAPAMSTITDWARDRGVTVLGLDGETKRITGDVTVCTPQAMAERANLLVSLGGDGTDRKSTRLNSSHLGISYAVFCLKKKKKKQTLT